MTTLLLEVVSDPVCPWCFLAEQRLRAALEQLRECCPEVRVALRWLPYFLNPETPAAGEPYLPFLIRKFGGTNEVRALHDQLRAAGRQSGVRFSFERIGLRPNSLKAQRLIWRAQRERDAGDLPRRLFEAYFEQGQNIGDDQVLAGIAAQCGADAAATIRYLSGDEDVTPLRAVAAQLQRRGVSGVPLFIFSSARVIAGAQSPASLLAAMREAIDRPAPTG